MALDEKSGDQQSYYNSSWTCEQGNMNVWTKFHRNPSNSCQDISFKATNVNLMVALQETLGSVKVSRRTRMSVLNFMAIHPIVVKIFQSGRTLPSLKLCMAKEQILYWENLMNFNTKKAAKM